MGRCLRWEDKVALIGGLIMANLVNRSSGWGVVGVCTVGGCVVGGRAWVNLTDRWHLFTRQVG